jgi:DNA-binding HxlR family transcriptional regulator
MSKKTYGQMCPIARALDVLGDRWTLLLIREFLLGPKRFKELLAVLPAMGTNRLSERLDMLVENGVVQRTALQGPTSATAYELTTHGEKLRKPVLALALWGMGLPMDERVDPATARAELIMLGLTAAVDSTLVADLHEQYEFQVGSEVFHVRVGKGTVLPRSGSSPVPVDVKINCDIGTFVDLAMRKISPSRALRERHLHLLQGDRAALGRVFKVLQYHQ